MKNRYLQPEDMEKIETLRAQSSVLPEKILKFRDWMEAMRITPIALERLLHIDKSYFYKMEKGVRNASKELMQAMFYISDGRVTTFAP